MTAAHLSRDDRGFTLVEVLVSLALIVLLLALLPNAMGLGRRAWETHEDAGARIERMARLAMLEQRLAEALPVFEATSATPMPGVVIAFTGEPTLLEFVAPSPGHGATGLSRWRLAASSGSRTEASARPFHATGADPAADTPMLAEREVALRLAYFGPAQPNDEPRWHERWPRTDALPALIEIVLTPERGGTARRLVVAPKLATP